MRVELVFGVGLTIDVKGDTTLRQIDEWMHNKEVKHIDTYIVDFSKVLYAFEKKETQKE